jgi:dienelactone hydrolase
MKTGPIHERPLLLVFFWLSLLALAAASAAWSQALGTNYPSPLQTPLTVRTVNTPREFPLISSRQQWQERARQIREQILVSCGLWPMPEKTPLRARIFDKLERDGYTIEKVYFQSVPGFYMGGNLYRPLGHGPGPFPAILNPHGHFEFGRLTDNTNSSTPARCISFARQGMIAFAYDMVGYNDTHFAGVPGGKTFSEIHHQCFTNQTDQLWSLSLMGLQTWNSLRALDFLESLPDADPKRLAITGESGGGTQTFMLGAIDGRLAVQAPVVMVSHSMQGGCLCENAPGLRVEYSNMEISAAAAPRPQLLVAATGDWTRDTLTVEGPAIERVYQLFGAADKFHYVRFDFGHNYNQTSREAVYAWFDRWLAAHPSPSPPKESPCSKEADADLRVFPNGELPQDALTQAQVREWFKERHRAQWQALAPKDAAGLERFRKAMLPAWQHTLQLRWPASKPKVQVDDRRATGGFTTASVKIFRDGESQPVVATYWAPPGLRGNKASSLVVLCGAGADAGGVAASEDRRAPPTGLALSLIRGGMAVLEVNRFSTLEPPNQFANFYSTYNRTKPQNRVGDLVAVCAAASSLEPQQAHPFRVILVGIGRAGLWSLLAAPGADAVVADCGCLDLTDETALLEPDAFCPGLLALGGFEAAAILASPHPLLAYNTGAKFPSASLRSAYQASSARARLRLEPRLLSEEELARWVVSLP